MTIPTTTVDIESGAAAAGRRVDPDLLVSVRPPGWKNPRPLDRYDVAVIGAGPAGFAAAVEVAGRGAKVALIERNIFGGNCAGGSLPLNIMSGIVRAYARHRAARMTKRAEFTELMKQMRQAHAHAARRFSVKYCTARGIMVFFGMAEFSADGVIEVVEDDGNRIPLRFKKAIIATGSRAGTLPDGVQPETPAGVVTSETLFSNDELPGRLAVIGSGHIGCRLAQVFARLGSDVTLIEEQLHLLPTDDHDAARLLADVFERDGINVMLDTRVLKIETENESGGAQGVGWVGGVHAMSGVGGVRVVRSGEERTIPVDMIFADTGRMPNVDGLGLENAGVAYDRIHGVRVNDQLQTSNPKIYAAGDVCLPRRFVHVAEKSARIAVHNVFAWRKHKFRSLAIPWCICTDPQIAHVGMLPQEAEDSGIQVRSFIKHIDELDSAVIEGEALGFVKVNTRRGRDSILGCTIVAQCASAMIGEFAFAIANGMGLRATGKTLHPYPCTSQAIDGVSEMYRRVTVRRMARKIYDTMLARR